MEHLILIIKLAKVLSWPATVTLILYFVHKKYGDSITSLLESRTKGSAGVRSEGMENLREKIMQLASEPDPKQRLKIAKEALKAENVNGK